MKFLKKVYDIIMTKQIIGSIITLLIAYILTKILNSIISKILITGKTQFEIKRRKTIIRLLQSIVKYIIYIISLLIILDFYGIDTRSLITSLGIFGAVLGLAMQDTIKDLICGISLILENYLQVGDTVTYNNFTGDVIELGLRTTKIKAFNGEVMIIANRNIDSIINASQRKAHLLIEVDTDYDAPVKKVEEVLTQVIEEAKKEKLIFDDSIYCGINELSSSSVKYLINIHCDQNKRYDIKRNMLKRIKLAYEQNNLKIPYNQIEVHHGKDI